MSGNSRSSISSSLSMETQIKNTVRKNHGRRPSEISKPMRRSFGGKNSGVDVPRGFNPADSSTSVFPRSSVDKTGKSLERGFEEKENEMDRFSKQSTVVSPCLTKPMKHFMSPTISAVSKINASPRKKILTEKNELTRSSWGSLNVCEEGDGARSEVEAYESHELTVTDSSSVRSRNSCMKKVVFDSGVRVLPPKDLYELSGEEEDENKVEKSPYIKSPRSPLAPLDADPSMTPYDPETNYLSPRPQFLHYHPTPRIERFLGEETDGHYLNDSIDFVEGLCETELTEEASSNDSSREPQNDVLIDKELKDDAEVVFTADDENIDVDARDVVPDEVSELTFVAGDVSDDFKVTTTDEMEAIKEFPDVENGKENATEAKKATKGLRFFTKFKFCALILAVLVAGIVMSGVHSPIASSGKGIINKDWRLYKIVQEAEIGEYAKMNVDVVVQNFGWLYDDSLDHIFGLIRKLRGESGFRGMNYHNLSAMVEDSVFKKESDIYLRLDSKNHERNVVKGGLLPGPEAESLDEEDESGNEDDNDSFEDAGRGVEGRWVDADIERKTLMPLRNEETKKEESDLNAIEREFPDKFEIDMRNESIEESLDADITGKTLTPLPDKVSNQEESDLDAIERQFLEKLEVDTRTESNEESSGIPERTEIESGDEWGEDDKPSNAQSFLQCLKSASEFQVDSLEVEKSNLETDYVRDKPSASIAVGGISALVLTLVTFAGLMHFKPKRTPSSKQEPWQEHRSQPWQKNNHASSTYTTVVDIIEESCPSEMSSYQKNSFKSERRIHKRESLASSSDFSTGSPSYGSFTTYEKFPLKHRNGEEEAVITPIRRSSRLLKQVTSP